MPPAGPTEPAAEPRTSDAAMPRGDSDAGSSAKPAIAGSASTEASTEANPPEGQTKAGLSKRKDRKWINRWAPERHMGELGVFGGVMIPGRDLELFETNPDLPQQGFRTLDPAAPEIGARIGYFPIRFFGLEVEGAVMPTRTKDFNVQSTLYTVRGHFVGQLGLWSVTPFVLFGAGALGVQSDRTALGDDVDASLHLGLGVKAYINRWIMARLDVRDIISARRGLGGVTNSPEVLLGVQVTLGREKDRPKPPPPVEPEPPGDRDGDGFLDPQDACPDEPGIAPDGCPIRDRDGDGFADDVDRCPDTPGIEPDGCPDPDPDKDGILGAADKCPNDPENRNGFEDEDGCPDEVPTDLDDFAGTLEGVNFRVNRTDILPSSRGILDKAAEILEKYPKIRIEISGHTDSTGARDHNMDLSRRRAESVRDYLVGKGVDASRIETRGAGPDEPIDTNATKDGKSRNRRIEFRVLD